MAVLLEQGQQLHRRPVYGPVEVVAGVPRVRARVGDLRSVLGFVVAIAQGNEDRTGGVVCIRVVQNLALQPVGTKLSK